jgi:hypothetical protein
MLYQCDLSFMPIIINLTVVNADWKEVWCIAVNRV